MQIKSFKINFILIFLIILVSVSSSLSIQLAGQPGKEYSIYYIPGPCRMGFGKISVYGVKDNVFDVYYLNCHYDCLDVSETRPTYIIDDGQTCTVKYKVYPTWPCIGGMIKTNPYCKEQVHVIPLMELPERKDCDSPPSDIETEEDFDYTHKGQKANLAYFNAYPAMEEFEDFCNFGSLNSSKPTKIKSEWCYDCF